MMATHKRHSKIFRFSYIGELEVYIRENFRFLRREQDVTYGTKNHNVDLMWFVYGYPKPEMTYYFNDEIIESGGRFSFSYTRNGQATLFVNK